MTSTKTCERKANIARVIGVPHEAVTGRSSLEAMETPAPIGEAVPSDHVINETNRGTNEKENTEESLAGSDRVMDIPENEQMPISPGVEKRSMSSCRETVTPNVEDSREKSAVSEITGQGATYVSSQLRHSGDLALEFEKEVIASRSTTASHNKSTHSKRVPEDNIDTPIKEKLDIAQESTETADEIYMSESSHQDVTPASSVTNEPMADKPLRFEPKTPINNNGYETINLPQRQRNDRRQMNLDTTDYNNYEDNEGHSGLHVDSYANETFGNRRQHPSYSRDAESLLSSRYYTYYHGDVRKETYSLPPATDNGIQQKAILDLMSKGLGNFTTEMAEIVIAKMKPQNETLARQVGQEVKEATVLEIKDLREKVTTAQKMVNDLCVEKEQLVKDSNTERTCLKKELEKERLKHKRDSAEKDEKIDILEKENKKIQETMKEREKLYKRAEHKAKSEEQKRIKLEEEHQKKLKELQMQLDKTKGDLLVQISKRRLHTSAKDKEKTMTITGRLRSHHGMHPRQLIHPKHVPYDEGDP